MELIHEIDNIKTILDSGNNLFVLTTRLSTNSDYIVIDPQYSIFRKRNYVYIYRDSIIKIFNENSKRFDIEYEDCFSISPSYCAGNQFLLYQKTNKIVHEVSNFEIVRSFALANSVSFYFDTKFISISGESYTDLNKVACYMIDSSNIPLWQFELPEGFKIFWQAQVVEDVLFFTADNNQTRESKTIALDIHTGKQLWELSKTIAYQVNTDNGLLYGYSARVYRVVNPKNGELLQDKSMLNFFDKGVCPYSFNNTIGGNRLWFVSGRGEKTKFGAINIETSEMEFVQDYPLDEDFQFSKPIYHNNKLYLLDSNKILRVFE